MQQKNLVSNTYDCGGSCYIVDRPGIREHDTANYDTGFKYRGNVTQRDAQEIITTLSYDITGAVTRATDNQSHTVDLSPASGTNFTMPGVITPNGHSVSFRQACVTEADVS